MALFAKPQLDAVVLQALLLHALAQARSVQQVDGALLQHASAYPVFDIVLAAVFENDGFDVVQVQQMGE